MTETMLTTIIEDRRRKVEEDWREDQITLLTLLEQAVDEGDFQIERALFTACELHSRLGSTAELRRRYRPLRPRERMGK